jgi:uncharacterized oligopeptide transporter (OPT) family protein
MASEKEIGWEYISKMGAISRIEDADFFDLSVEEQARIYRRTQQKLDEAQRSLRVLHLYGPIGLLLVGLSGFTAALVIICQAIWGAGLAGFGVGLLIAAITAFCYGVDWLAKRR